MNVLFAKKQSRKLKNFTHISYRLMLRHSTSLALYAREDLKEWKVLGLTNYYILLRDFLFVVLSTARLVLQV